LARARCQQPCGCGWQRGGSWPPHPLQRYRRRMRRRPSRRGARGGTRQAGAPEGAAHAPTRAPPPACHLPHALLARAGRPSPPAPNGTARAVTWPRRARPTAFFFSVSFSPPPAARPLGLRPRLCAFLSNPSSAPSLRDIQARQSHRRACTVTQCDLCVFESR
jgi:hypothetical protein